MSATNRGSLPVLILAGPCPRTPGDRPHTWQPGDCADLVSYGHPDHGLSVWLGRCQHCTLPLLAITPLDADTPDRAPRYEVPGAEL
jgi:hypothetical protein